MAHNIFQVDAFATECFQGNPAAVCILEEDAPDGWRQHIAAEMNLSETAFLHRMNSDVWELRWFTPTQEVDLCGHATLASAHVLWKEQGLDDDVLTFGTKSGKLTARKDHDGIQLDFPAELVKPVEFPDDCVEVLKVTPKSVLENRMDLMVVLDDEEAVAVADPAMDRLKKWAYRGVIITAESSGDHDFVSRFFAPRVGVPEDPVTGSAHCALVPYWSDRLGKTVVRGYQASQRGGYVKGIHQGDRVLLTGEAVTIFRGELMA